MCYSLSASHISFAGKCLLFSGSGLDSSRFRLHLVDHDLPSTPSIDAALQRDISALSGASYGVSGSTATGSQVSKM